MSIETKQIAKYEKIGGLSLLKFLLIFVVFLFHWNMHFGVVYSNKLINRFVDAGAFAMGGFFILSGFLLYYIYSKNDFTNFEYLKTFYLKRLIKILPIYYIVVFIMYILYSTLAAKSVNWTVMIMQIIPLQAYFSNLFGEFVNGGLWFVSVILFLYFLFPFLMFIVKSIKTPIRFALFVYLVGIFPCMVNCYYPDFSIYYLPYFRISEFVIGMLCARMYMHSTKPLKYASVYVLLTSIAIFFSVAILYKANFFNHIKFSVNYLNYDVILLLLFPMLIYFIAKSKDKIFLYLTQNKVVDYLGKITYCFFLTQLICEYIMLYWVKPNNYFNMSGLTILITSFILNLVLAIIFYEIFENKLSNYLLKKLKIVMDVKNKYG